MPPARSASEPLAAEVFHPCALPDRDLAAWTRLQAATPDFSSPLLSPDFARAVGEVRADARVAVWRRGGEAVGFLSHHQRPGRLARPVGSPFSDYHALVSAPGAIAKGPEALALAGIRTFRFSGLIDPFGLFASVADERTEGHQVVLTDGADAFLAALAASSRNRAKNFRRYHARLERELGPVEIRAPNTDAAAFEQLLAWKRAQIARTGALDFLRPAWCRELMSRLYGRREGAFQGLLVSLYAGSTHVASHFGVRLGGHYHPWLGASHPDHPGLSPGFVHQWLAIGAMSALGLDCYDLGPGYDHWKRMFANSALTIAAGTAATSPQPARSWPLEAVWSLPSAGRVRRRLDQIAATELTLSGRVHGLVSAMASYDRRLAARAGELHAEDGAERAAP